MSEDSTKDLSAPVNEPEITRLHDNIMYSGVGGWLAFFIAVNLYFIPIMFIPGQILADSKYIGLASQHPLAILSGAIFFAVRLYLVILGVKAAIALRDIKPLAVQNVRSFIIKSYIWIYLSIPVSLMSGIEKDNFFTRNIIIVIMSTIGFVIWILYFKKSKRVQATYPDWQD
jgi:small-conductance mechanosensitive channel